MERNSVSLLAIVFALFLSFQAHAIVEDSSVILIGEPDQDATRPATMCQIDPGSGGCFVLAPDGESWAEVYPAVCSHVCEDD